MAKILGSIEPRIYTPPLRPLTKGTSLGFDIIEWYEGLGGKLWPHQKWLLVHALEYLPRTKTLRFKHVLVEKARRNAKTHTLAVYSAWLLCHRQKASILNSSLSLTAAQESFETIEAIIEDHPTHFPQAQILHANGKESIKIPKYQSKFRVVPASRRGGRSKTATLAVEDELREHADWTAHSALAPTIVTEHNGQLWMLSSAGDAQSEVLNAMRERGIQGTNPHMFYAGWTAPDGCDIDDRKAWAQANPLMNRAWDESTLEAAMSVPAAEFRTEYLCQTIPAFDEAVSPAAWAQCLDPGNLNEHRSRIAAFLDVSSDLRHATLCAAATLPSGKTRIEIARSWDNLSALRAELPTWVGKVNPRTLGYFPSGPSAAIAVDLKGYKALKEMPSQSISAACMGLAEQVNAGQVLQNGDELLAAHILQSRKQLRGEGWVFSRKDGGHIDAAYAAAGALLLARQIPKAQPLVVITV